MIRNFFCFSKIVLLLFVSTVYSQTVFAFQIAGKEVDFEQVAVVVFPKTDTARKMQRSAQTRIENILLDNGITILDQDRAEELKNVWKKLEDPGYFITAEDFVANAEQYDIDGLIRLYLNADANQGLANFYTATAQADIRFVDSEANVEAHTTVPMGVPGVPPSDGLTRNAALVNAIQRAVDEAAAKTGLEIIDYARPRTLSFEFNGPVDVPIMVNAGQRALHDFSAYANIANQTWTREEVTTTCKAPSGELGAVGGYIRDTKMGMRRTYSSVIHLVDLAEKKETGVFNTTTGKKKGRSGSVKILDCMFITSWRYLAAVTGLELFLWDTERGNVMSAIRLDKGIQDATLAYNRYNNNDYISINTGGDVLSYQVVRKK